jgi:hypothetical protein
VQRGPIRVIEVLTPGGFESYFDECEEEHRRARAELGERYRVIWDDERSPEARARFDLGSWLRRSADRTFLLPRPPRGRCILEVHAQDVSARLLDAEPVNKS